MTSSGPSGAKRDRAKGRRARIAVLATAVTALALLAAMAIAGRNGDASKAPGGGQRSPTRATLRVPSTHVVFKLDGELDEPVWNASSARTGPFVDGSGGEARPYSEGRFLWDAENLYVALYAADDNIQASVTAHDGPVWIDDAFSLHLTPASAPGAPTYLFDISAAGVVMDAKRLVGGQDDVSWESGIKLGVDKDGTLNNPSDMDEEWVVEAAIPWKSMGIDPKPGVRVAVAVSRCDTPRGTKEKRCGSWGTDKDPRVLELTP